MRTRYHVVVLDPSASTLLLEHHGSMWLMPTAAAEDTVRSVDVVTRCLTALGLSGRIRWIEALSFGAASMELQLLAVVDAMDAVTRSRPHASLVATPLMGTHPAHAMLPAQARALAAFRSSADHGSYGHCDYRSRTMWQALDRWVERALQDAGLHRAGDVQQYKALASDCVMTIPTTTGTVHVKGHADSAFVEAELGQYLAARFPAHVAPTLAYDRRHGWWMTARAPGVPLTHDPTLGKTVAVVDTLVSIQADVRGDADDLLRIGCPRLNLDEVLQRALTLLENAAALDSCPRVVDLLIEAATTLQRVDAPLTWLHTDLADSNIFVDDAGGAERVTFIDLAYPVIGPAPIALYSFLHYLPGYVDHARLIEENWTSTLKRRYAWAWSARGWPDAGESLFAAKLFAYAMKTLKGFESTVARVRDDHEPLARYLEGRAGARLCQAVLAADAARSSSTRRERQISVDARIPTSRPSMPPASCEVRPSAGIDPDRAAADSRSRAANTEASPRSG